MRMSNLYMPTLREVPAEAELSCHQLLLRAGLVRKLVSGVYTFLPLGAKVFQKVEKIVREEMDLAGAQEVIMPVLQPAELWQQTGRWEDFGPEMFRLKDRNARSFCLGPTHEEVITDLIKDELKSYKQLPLNLYQIQVKFRDEKRPRFGLIRGREFVMKDAYSFDMDEAGMLKAYEVMWEAYVKIFDRLRLNYKVVLGDAGVMGKRTSHEFMALSSHGESAIAYCSHCDFAATDEKAEVKLSFNLAPEEMLPLEKIYTPHVGTISALVEEMHLPAEKLVKTLLFKSGEDYIAVMIPGERQLNLIKLENYLSVSEHDLLMLSEEEVRQLTKANVGFAGPVQLPEQVRIIADRTVFEIDNMIVGANETDYHMKNVNLDRDFKAENAGDLLTISLGDSCPVCGKEIFIERGTEVGNIFQLGDKYSASLNATFLDEQGKANHFWMGSYGIGISRTMQAIIAQNSDEKGIIWPLETAPFEVIITIVNVKKEAQLQFGKQLYEMLQQKGYQVLLDDRNERAGVKFNDAELIGIPVRLTVGKDVEEGYMEISERKTGETQKILCEAAEQEILKIFEKQGYKKF